MQTMDTSQMVLCFFFVSVMDGQGAGQSSGGDGHSAGDSDS